SGFNVASWARNSSLFLILSGWVTGSPNFRVWALRIAAVVALILASLDVAQSLAANPDGGYDAAAIWNLRARYLAGGPASWHFAVSDKTGTNHPGYPLLLSSFVARTWIVLGDLRSSAPAALSVIFALATVAVLAAAVAALEGEALGWLAALVLLATEGFVSQSSIQYADVPLSFFILSSIALLAIASQREWPPGLVALAGIFAGFAAWTKNEGLAIVALICVVALWRRAKWFLAGAALPVILTLVFKFTLVAGRESMFPATAAQAFKMIGDVSRWSEIVASFAKNFWEMGFPWAHPLLLLAILAWAFGFAADARARWWLFVAPLGLLAADFGVYLITMSGLTWHLGTSNNRVIVQVWPAFLFGFFLLLKPSKVRTS
ncbi:MAG: phospholipid carrier-dependent glycosyltransferase, partial [Acidobacteriia bacterium]|nr:phospholipid carrier-dependent glycosyltransferase [Terriglobia bacterium]